MPKKTGHYAKLNTPGSALAFPPVGALASHWFFRGCCRWTRPKGLSSSGSTPSWDWPWPGCCAVTWPSAALGGGMLAAHTLNFLTNGQIFGVLKHYGGPGVLGRLRRRSNRVGGTARREPSLFCGRLRKPSPRTLESDVGPGRAVRAGAGLTNAWRACWFALRESPGALAALPTRPADPRHLLCSRLHGRARLSGRARWGRRRKGRHVKTVSRRGFLRLLAMGGAAAAVPVLAARSGRALPSLPDDGRLC